MLDAKMLSDLKRAAQEGRAKSQYGALVKPDNTFSNSNDLLEIIGSMSNGVEESPTAEKKTWSIVEPTTPLPNSATDIAHFKFDETTGTTAADVSANDNDLTLTGAWASGKFGNCLNLNGTTQYGSVLATSIEPLTNMLYVSCWINPDSVTGTRPLVKLDDRFLLYLSGNELKAQFYDGVTTYTVSSGKTVAIGSFQFVTLQYNAGDVYLAVGDLVYKTTIAMTAWAEAYPSTGKTLWVGYDETNFYDGKIDDLFIDANTRVEDDWPVMDNYGGPNDVIMWPFYENSGTLAHSGSLFGTTLTLDGATWVAGRTAYGVHFDGSNDFASCTPTEEAFTGTVSVEVGIKFDVDAACPIITQANGINISYDGSGNITAAFGGVTNPSSTVGSLTITTGVWYNLTIVYDGTNKELWINGQKYGEIAATGTATLTDDILYLARNGATYGHCVIDRVRIYRGRLRPFYRTIKYFIPGLDGFGTSEEWMIR